VEDRRTELKAYIKAYTRDNLKNTLLAVPVLKTAPSVSLTNSTVSTRPHANSVISERPAVLIASYGRISSARRVKDVLLGNLIPNDNKGRLSSDRYQPKPTTARPDSFESFPPPRLSSSLVEETAGAATTVLTKPPQTLGVIETLRRLFEGSE
jgi:hypothetical protein